MVHPPQLHSLIFLSISIIICSPIAPARALFWYCQTDWGFYPNGSTYESNLKQLVLSLASNASKSGGFYSSTVGVGSTDQINGLIMCYADASETDCQDCLTTAANDVANLLICEYRMTAATHYESCFLYYSNITNFHKTIEFQPDCLDSPDANTTVPQFLNSSSVQSLISRLTTVASHMGQKYASNKTNYMGNQTMYGLVQCTKDLSADECGKCAQSAIAYANALPNCSDQFGARIMNPNCYIRYNIHSFDVAPYAVSTPPLLISPARTPVSHSRSENSVASFKPKVNIF